MTLNHSMRSTALARRSPATVRSGLHRASLALGLTVLPAFAAAALANYPFHLETHRDGDGQQIVAINDGPAPVWVVLSLKEAQNVHEGAHWPLSGLVGAHQHRVLTTLYAADRTRAFRFGVSSSFSLGDPKAVPDSGATYLPPFERGRFPITQARGGRVTTHTTPASLNAIDITMPEGTPIVAARPGTVIDVDLSHHASGTDANLLDQANLVEILHSDGTLAVYAHLKAAAPQVHVGERVAAGQRIGWSGNTGFSSGPHLHFAVLRNRLDAGDRTHLESVPVVFQIGDAEIPPAQGMVLTANVGQAELAPRVAPGGGDREVIESAFGWLSRTPAGPATTWLRARPPGFWGLMALDGVLLVAFLALWRRFRHR